MEGLFGLLYIIGLYTIWFTPILFVTNLIGAIKAIKEEKDLTQYIIICNISFFLIIITIVSGIFLSSY